MTAAEREPFAQYDEPFAQYDSDGAFADPTEAVVPEAVTASPATETDVPAGTSDAVSVQDTVRRNAVMKVNVTTYTKAVLQRRATAERRTMSVVLTEAVRQFLLRDTYEPRPYIPHDARPLMTGDRQKLTASVPVEMLESLTRRADEESRDMSTLVTRAILDYIKTEVD